jgi:hypothetical protein
MRGGVSHLVEDSVDGLESTTGLKLRDATIGRAHGVAAVTQDKASSIAQNIQERTAEFQKRAAAIAGDVQAKLGPQEQQKSKVSPDAPPGLLTQSKEPEASLESIKEKVKEAVTGTSKSAWLCKKVGW